MARLRKFVAYRNLKRPYTRWSKYRKKSFIKVNPVCRIVKFDLGNKSKKFPKRVDLISKSAINIRDNALESARQTANRFLEKNLGKSGYYMKIRVYPHHILREHALAAGAGADRFSSGMAHAFGKPTGNAARIREGQVLVSVYVNQPNLMVARKALDRAKHKLPTKCQILVVN